MLIVLISLSSCLTQAPKSSIPTITKQAADLTITLHPLDYDALRELHGSNRQPDKKVNPYIDYPGQIPQRRIVVFDTEFKTETSTIMINIREIELAIGGRMGKAASVAYLTRLWESYIDDTPYVNTIPDVARRTMLPREIVVTPGENVSGYLVFAEPFPKDGGEGLLTIPVSADTGDKGVIEIEINFEDPEAGVHQEKNTGIFAEEES